MSTDTSLWLKTARDPRWVVAPSAFVKSAEHVVRAMSAPALPSLDEPLHWISWARAVNVLPKAADGDVSAFLEASAQRHQVSITLDDLRETLWDQHGEGEQPEMWRLVARDETSFWFLDPLVAPRLRLVALRFSYDHLHCNDEIVSVGDLFARGIARLLASSSLSSEVLPAPELPHIEIALGQEAAWLDAALSMIGHPCLLRDAQTVAGIGAPESRWAAAQLEAAQHAFVFERPGTRAEAIRRRLDAPLRALSPEHASELEERLLDYPVAPVES